MSLVLTDTMPKKHGKKSRARDAVSASARDAVSARAQQPAAAASKSGYTGAYEYKLHAFVDHSVVETFWNDRVMVSTHVWPLRESRLAASKGLERARRKTQGKRAQFDVC